MKKITLKGYLDNLKPNMDEQMKSVDQAVIRATDKKHQKEEVIKVTNETMQGLKTDSEKKLYKRLVSNT